MSEEKEMRETLTEMHRVRSVDKIADAYVKLADRINSLFDALKHGDADHQGWLKEAIYNHIHSMPMPAYNAGKPKLKVPTNGEMIEAADAYATAYDDDDRVGIKTDVINAYYAGIKMMLDAFKLPNTTP